MYLRIALVENGYRNFLDKQEQMRFTFKSAFRITARKKYFILGKFGEFLPQYYNIKNKPDISKVCNLPVSKKNNL